MAEEAAASFFGKLAELLLDPLVRQFCYLCQYRSNIENLKDELDGLQASREGVKIQIDAAEYNLETVAPNMQSWATRVDEIEKRASGVIERTSNVDNKCLNVWCPNVKRRYLLSRNATKLTRSIGKLKGEGKSYTKSTYSAPPPGIVTPDALLPELITRIDATPSIRSCEDLVSRKPIFERVMNALENDTIKMIGISGSGGVGKTTFVNEVCQKARAQSLFEQFAMTAVSKKQELFKIQDELAAMLGLNFTEKETTLVRAHRLRSRLTNGKKILVILDDIWEEIPLKQVGIPGKGDPGACKVIFTSREKHLFSDMGTQFNVTVEVLTLRESWDLFKENFGDYGQHITAKDIVDNCKGIPIAIVTLAKALRKQEAATWDNALNDLKQSTGTEIFGVEEDAAYRSVKLSYNLLKDNKAKTLLLLCCLFPEDAIIPLETLIKFDSSSDIEVRRSNVSNLVVKLRSCNLLEEGNSPESLKVHDIVRDVCLTTEGLNTWSQYDMSADFCFSEPSAKLENGDFKFRTSAYKQVLDALIDDQVYVIMIIGFVSAGKTQMAYDIKEKVLADNLFDEVAMATMTKIEDMRKVQASLGGMLGLTSLRDESDITKRAQLLHERLTNGSRILVVLDDVWDSHDLKSIGIPAERDEAKGCKVIITTRVSGTCGIITQKRVMLRALSREDLWEFFKHHVGHSNGENSPTSVVYSFGRQLFKTFGGDSLFGIVEGDMMDLKLLANTLKHQVPTEWNEFLKSFKGSDVGFYPNYPQVCFQLLRNPYAQRLLLLCCIMGEDANIPIEKLVKCVKALQWFGEDLGLEETRIKIYDLLQLLWDASLLLKDDNGGMVRVYYNIRDEFLRDPFRRDYARFWNKLDFVKIA